MSTPTPDHTPVTDLADHRTRTTVEPMEPAAERYDAQGRRLCSAHRSDGVRCRGPALRGQRVCRSHGGSSPQARASANVRLSHLTEDAVEQLAVEMQHATTATERLRAADAILDRAGVPRHAETSPDEDRARLLARLIDLREHLGGDVQGDPNDE